MDTSKGSQDCRRVFAPTRFRSAWADERCSTRRSVIRQTAIAALSACSRRPEGRATRSNSAARLGLDSHQPKPQTTAIPRTLWRCSSRAPRCAPCSSCRRPHTNDEDQVGAGPTLSGQITPQPLPRVFHTIVGICATSVSSGRRSLSGSRISAPAGGGSISRGGRRDLARRGRRSYTHRMLRWTTKLLPSVKIARPWGPCVHTDPSAFRA